MRIKPLVALYFWILEFDDVTCIRSIELSFCKNSDSRLVQNEILKFEKCKATSSARSRYHLETFCLLAMKHSNGNHIKRLFFTWKIVLYISLTVCSSFVQFQNNKGLKQHFQDGLEERDIYIYMLFAGWEVRIVKNCDRAFSRPRSQFFTIRTDPKPVNNFFFFFFRVQKNCFKFCKHKDKISRKRYRGPWADIGESCPR